MISGLIRKYILAKSYNKDKARQEFILNILLLGSIFISFVAFLSAIVAQLSKSAISDATAPQIIFLFFLFLSFLFFLSRKGHVKEASFILIFFFYLSSLYTSFKWGADVTQAQLLYALIIVMSGVLIGTRFAFFLTISVVVIISTLGFLQVSALYHPSESWRTNPFTFGDTVLLNITLVVIAVISWLSNREIEKTLTRARASESELKKERDMLEIKVEERTKDLKQAQLEKMTQIYRFAEIGRLSSGLFHDLATPLSLVSLHLDRLKYKHEQGSIDNVQVQLKKAIHATKYLESFVKAVRKQMQSEGSDKMFSLNKEIKMVIQMLNHKARSQNVKNHILCRERN